MSYIAFMLYAVQGEKETMSTIPACDAAKHALMDVNG
jgi:hypothetical protein